MTPNPDLAADVAAASAAYLFNVLPAIAELPPTEAFERLKQHFETCLLAYRDGLAGFVPEPSLN